MEADLDPLLNIVRLGVGTGAHNKPVVPACSDRLDSDSHSLKNNFVPDFM